MSTPRHLALLGSSRKDGETARALAQVLAGRDVTVVDIGGLDLSFYDYQHRNASDDFLPLARQMAAADSLLFATPVYWYAMSAQMKMLFDRMSDLLGPEKTLGRALAGRRAALLATGTGAELPPGFDLPFSQTAAYFEISWHGSLYLPVGKSLEADDLRAAKITAFTQGFYGD